MISVVTDKRKLYNIKKITNKYHVNKEDYEFQDIIYEEKGIKWVSELYITSTEYCITVIYKKSD